MIAHVEHATIGPLQALGVAGQAVGHAGRGADAAADARPAHRRGAAARSRLQRRRHRAQLRAEQRVDLSHGNLRSSASDVHRDDRAREAARPPSAARANDEAARDFERVPRQIAVPLFRQVANVLKADGYLVHRLHAGGQRPADVGPRGRGLHRADARHDGRRAAGDRPHQPRPRPPRRSKPSAPIGAPARLTEDRRAGVPAEGAGSVRRTMNDDRGETRWIRRRLRVSATLR